MPHGYTDDTLHGYRKSFSLIGVCNLLKAFLLQGWHNLLNKKKEAETNYFLSYTALQLS